VAAQNKSEANTIAPPKGTLVSQRWQEHQMWIVCKIFFVSIAFLLT
jgi:hypothetical protein